MNNETTESPAVQPDASIAGMMRGVCAEIGALPPGAIINEDALARMLGKNCRESIRRAVNRGELPRPTKIMGARCWTAGCIVRHIEARLVAAAKSSAEAAKKCRI